MKRKLSLVGYSGHAYVCAEIALLNNIKLYGYYEKNKKKENPYNLEYLGQEENINDNNNIFISIGDNNIRKKIYQKLSHANFKTKLLHPNSIISSTANISNQVLICSGAIVNPQVKIGFGSIINTGSLIEHGSVIEKFCHIAPGAVILGDVLVGEGSLIGANSVIKQGVKIGKNSIVGAGSVVLTDVNDNCRVVGNPCRKI